jgi:tetratricopeptide (TPR) repeat protein
MRAELEGAAFVKYAGRFVWLSLDVDKPQNQPFLHEHAFEGGVPVFLVIDAASGKVLASLMGQADVPAMEAFLQRAERNFKGGARGAGPPGAADRGDALLGNGKADEAARAYDEALRGGGASASERERLLDARLTALQIAGKNEECARAAATAAPGLPRRRAFAGVVLTGLTCAISSGPAPWGEPMRRALEPLAAEAIAIPAILDDDRYQLYERRIFARMLAHDEAAARALGAEWLARIERDDKSGVQGPDAQQARDVARVRAATRAGEPRRIVAALEATTRAQPGSYTAWARLAGAYLQVHRAADADAAIARALAAGPGPLGRTNLLVQRADAQLQRGDGKAARATLEEATRLGQSIEPASVRAPTLQHIAQKQKALPPG